MCCPECDRSDETILHFFHGYDVFPVASGFNCMLQGYSAQYSSDDELMAFITGFKGEFAADRQRLELLLLSKIDLFSRWQARQTVMENQFQTYKVATSLSLVPKRKVTYQTLTVQKKVKP